jgi:hypothetical protein
MTGIPPCDGKIIRLSLASIDIRVFLRTSHDKAVRLKCLTGYGFSRGMISRAAIFFVRSNTAIRHEKSGTKKAAGYSRRLD